jgi:hypothetical protein
VDELTYCGSGRVGFRKSVLADVVALKDRLRPEHVAEVWASGHHTPEYALASSYLVSDASYTFIVDGVISAMCGVSRDPSGNGCLWLLCSADVDKVKVTFFKLACVVIETFIDRYPLLFNFVDCRYLNSIKWLKRLGANFQNPVQYGPEGLPFSLFTIRREK